MATCRECGSVLSVLDSGGLCRDCRSAYSATMLEQASCRRCGRTFRRSELTGGKCAACTDAVEAETSSVTVGPVGRTKKSGVFVTTETSVALPISQRLGIVASECVLGLNIFMDLGASIRDIFGGRAKGYQAAIAEARESLITDLKRQAIDMQADAVVATTITYSEISGGGKGMVLLAATGTAVQFSDVV